MSATAKKEQEFASIYFVLLGVLFIFFLIRPPFLLLWAQVFSGGAPGFQTNSAGESRAAPKLPIVPPDIPIPEETPDRWQPFQSSPQMLALSSRIVELTNNERSQMNLGRLKTDPRLSEIAALHSRDMVERGYMAHNSPDGDGPSQRVSSLHRELFGAVSENLAYIESAPSATEALAQRFVSGWMNSLGHRRNILDAASTHFGVGCFDRHTQGDAGERKCTQLFSDARAYAASPVADMISRGESLQIYLDPAQFPGAPAPTGVEQLDLATDSAISTASFNRTPDGMLVAELPVTGPPGIYGARLCVPDAAPAASRYWIIPGPYFTLREGP